MTELNGTTVFLSSWPSSIDAAKYYVNTCHERTYKAPHVLSSPCLDHAQPHPKDILRAVDWLVCADGKEGIVHCKGGHGRSAAVALGAMIAKEYAEEGIGAEEARKICARELGEMRSVRKKLGGQGNIKDFCKLVEETWVKGGGWKRIDGGERGGGGYGGGKKEN